MPDSLSIAMVRARSTGWTIESLASGSQEALGQLYEELGRPLFRTAYRVMGSRQDAEDVLHDLFVGLPELLTRYEDRGRFEAWLRRVVVRMCLMRLRSQAARVVSIEQEEPSSDRLPSDRAFVADLERALEKLPPALRTVFVLKQLEGYTHEEIAVLTNITAGAARVRYSRALDRLRQYLEP